MEAERRIERHMTVPELAEREGVPVATVHRWNSTGLGPAYMRIGKFARYRLADVLSWEAERMSDPRGTAA